MHQRILLVVVIALEINALARPGQCWKRDYEADSPEHDHRLYVPNALRRPEGAGNPIRVVLCGGLVLVNESSEHVLAPKVIESNDDL